jgi:hypothetical protein
MSKNDDPDRGPERPRFEPEIIPPGRDNRARGDASWSWIRIEERDGAHRIAIARPSLPSIILGLLALGLIAAVVLFVLAGVVLIWIPVVVGGILLALLSGAIRYHWRRLQGWWASRR